MTSTAWVGRIVGVIIVIGSCHFVNAQVIDFEGIGDQVSVTNQYQPLGVTFTNVGSAATWGGITNGDPGNWDLDGTNGPYFYGIQAESLITLDFDNLVFTLSLDTSRSLGSDPTNTFTLAALLNNVPVDSQTILQNDINSWTTVTVVGPFDSVQLTSADGNRPVYGIDNIRWEVVPEPSTLAVALLSTVMLGMRRRRSAFAN